MRKGLVILIGLTIALTACGGGGSTPTVGNAEPTSVGSSTSPGSPSRPISTATRPAGTVPATPATSGTASVVRSATTTRTVTGATRTVSNATPGAPLPSAAPVVFSPVPWQPGDRTRYNVTARDTGQPAGSASYVLGREFEADTISATLTINQTQDRFQLGFDTKTLAPVSELRSIVTAQGTIDIQSEFHTGGATIQVINSAGTKRNALTLPPNYYANDQFLTILRALPFAEGYQGSLVLVPSQGEPPTLATVVTVTGQEDVSTSFGAIRCWRVEAQFEGSTTVQVLWYGVATPNYLVKYDTGRYLYLLAQKP